MISFLLTMQIELVIAETRQSDGACAQIVYRNNASVEAADLERLCVKVRPLNCEYG